MSGSVKLFNAGGTKMTLTVGGSTQIDVLASAGPPEWIPGSSANRVPWSSSGNASDGEFGWTTNCTLRPEGGEGKIANFTVNIPKEL